MHKCTHNNYHNKAKSLIAVIEALDHVIIMMVSYFHSGYRLSSESYISGPHAILEEGTNPN